MKQCSKCKKVKLKSEFHKSNKHSTGLKPDCKECRGVERKKAYHKFKDELGYYVYTHSDSNGEVFYVGSGCGRRAYDHQRRGFEWKEVVEKVEVDTSVAQVGKVMVKDYKYERYKCAKEAVEV